MQKNDTTRASMLANELSEVRKMNNVVMQSKLALEQLNLRLNTIQDLGDLANTLAPAINVIKGVQPGLINLVPDAEREIGEISSLLSGILVDAGQTRRWGAGVRGKQRGSGESHRGSERHSRGENEDKVPRRSGRRLAEHGSGNGVGSLLGEPPPHFGVF